jgi:hypothetical protein
VKISLAAVTLLRMRYNRAKEGLCASDRCLNCPRASRISAYLVVAPN